MTPQKTGQWISLKDIEITRRYHLPNNALMIINRPQKLFINDDNSHKVVDLQNRITEIPSSWRVFSASTQCGDFSFNVDKDIPDSKDFNWESVSSNKLIYLYADLKYVIHNPAKILKKESGSHKVVDHQGTIHYMTHHFLEMKVT